MRYDKLNVKKRFSRIIFYVFIFVLIVSFLFGISGGMIFTDNDYVIRVGESKVSKRQWNSILARSNIDPTKINDKDVQNQVLQISNDIILKYVIYEEAKNLGIKITDGMVQKEILKLPYFYKDGKFSQEQFKKLINNYGFTEDEYINDLKIDLVVQKFFMDSFSMQKKVIPSLIDPVMDEYLKTRDIKMITIPFSSINYTKPTEKSLHLIYDQVKPMTPPKADISYAFINPVVNKKDFISEEQLLQKYEAMKLLTKTEETRDVSRIPFSSFKEAKKAFKKLENGVDFHVIAKEHHLKDQELQLKSVKRDDFDKYISDIIFSLKEGQFSKPIDTDLGIFIFKVNKITEGIILPFDNLKEDISAVLLRNEREKLKIQYYSEISNLLENQVPFEKIVSKFNLKRNQARVINDGKEGVIDGIKKSTINKFLFDSSELIKIITYGEGKYVLIAKDRIIEPKPENFKNVRDKLQNDYFIRELPKMVEKIKIGFADKKLNFTSQNNSLIDVKKIKIESFILEGNKDYKKIPQQLIPIIHNTDLGKLSKPYIDYKNKKIFFVVLLSEANPTKNMKFKLHGFFEKNISEIENANILSSVKMELINKYKSKIDNKILNYYN